MPRYSREILHSVDLALTFIPPHILVRFTMAASRPTVVLIPGFWHTSEVFGLLSALLRKANYPIVPFDLPSANAHPGHPDFSQDVAAVRTLVTGLADAGKEVVVLMHSGGSVIGSEALRDLSKEERAAAGKNGGVVRLVYIGILLPKAGTTMMETFMGAITSPDLDPDFVADTNQDAHVIAEVGNRSLWAPPEGEN
jgi:pimeloyl-ACP methyl ester carboxylesterase